MLKKASVTSMLDFISWGSSVLKSGRVLQLYKTLVWLNLEYCVQYYRTNVETLQRMQKGLLELESIHYEKRLDTFGLFSQDCQRLRVNLIEVYKIIRGIDSQSPILGMKMSNTRRHRFKVRGGTFNAVQGMFFYTEKCAYYNAQPGEMVEADTNAMF